MKNTVTGFGMNQGSGSIDRSWVDRVASITSATSLNIDVGTYDANGDLVGDTGTTSLLGSPATISLAMVRIKEPKSLC